jgi:hypothetical protein
MFNVRAKSERQRPLVGNDALPAPGSSGQRDAGAPAPQWWRIPRSFEQIQFHHVAIVLVLGLAAWGYLDVRHRGEVVPGHIESHSTDFTVYTEAAAAFLDGRDPYRVTNPRGWFYLYPPLFALLVSPLASLSSQSQVLAWFAVSVLLAFGCYYETRRLWRFLLAFESEAGGPGVDRFPKPVPLGLLAGATVLLPSLECLQRGQVGIALLYPLLLGFRLALTGGNWSIRCLGGVVLALPVVMKVIPALPVGLLLAQWWAVILAQGWSRRSVANGAPVSLGVVLGLLLFVLFIPAAWIGWEPNLRHLSTWAQKVVMNKDPGHEAKVDIDTAANQSLANAAHRLAARFRAVVEGTALGSVDEDKSNPAAWMTAVIARAERRRADQNVRRAVQAVQAIILTWLLVLGVTMVQRRDLLGQAAIYGLNNLAVVLVSPVAWTHYYLLALPALLFVPLWLARRGRPIAARVVAPVPALLIWAHYLARPWVGTIGLLGLGTAVWFVAVLGLAARSRSVSLPTPATCSKPATD